MLGVSTMGKYLTVRVSNFSVAYDIYNHSIRIFRKMEQNNTVKYSLFLSVVREEANDLQTEAYYMFMYSYKKPQTDSVTEN